MEIQNGPLHDKWHEFQHESFIKWVNHQLASRSIQINNLDMDFSDGLALINLLEIVTEKQIKQYIRNPRFVQQKIDNIEICMRFIEREMGMKVLGYNPIDIASGNQKQIMGIVFIVVKWLERKVAGKPNEVHSPRTNESTVARVETGKELLRQPSHGEDRKKLVRLSSRGENRTLPLKDPSQSKRLRKDLHSQIHQRVRNEQEPSTTTDSDQEQPSPSSEGSEREGGLVPKIKKSIKAFKSHFGSEQIGFELKVYDPKLVIKLQSLVRRYIVLQRFIKRKNAYRERVNKLKDNPKLLHAFIRFQAIVRGRIRRRKFRKINPSTKRTDIAKEILSTERTYVKGLQVMVKSYLEPLKRQPESVISQANVKKIFQGVEVIYSFNEELLTRLEKRMSEWYLKGQVLGDIFLEMVKFTKVYTMYVNNYNNALATFNECRKKNPQFAQFYANVKAQVGGGDFAFYLIMPIQRLPRYVLLLQDLLKNTPPDHIDYEQLDSACTQMKEVTDHVNKGKREAEGLSEIFNIQERLEGRNVENLLEPGRKLVWQGAIAELVGLKAASAPQRKSRYLFVFNDMIISTKAIQAPRENKGSPAMESFPPPPPGVVIHGAPAAGLGKSRFIWKEKLLLTGASLKDSKHAFKSIEGASHCFELYLRPVDTELDPTEARRVFSAADAKEKRRWMSTIDDAIGQLWANHMTMYLGTPGNDLSAQSPPTPNRNEKCDKQGVLWRRSSNEAQVEPWKQWWYLLQNSYLYKFSTPKDDEPVAEPVGHLWVLACSVHVVEVMDRHNCFELRTAKSCIYLSAETSELMYEWIAAIRNIGWRHTKGSTITPHQHHTTDRASVGVLQVPSSSSSSDNTVGAAEEEDEKVRELVQKSRAMPGNSTCADCSANDPRWVNVERGIFLCTECSGIHRRLNFPVKNAGFGKWQLEWAEKLYNVGNEKSNQDLEPSIPSYVQKPNDKTTHGLKIKYIQTKYLCEKASPAAAEQDLLKKEFHSAKLQAGAIIFSHTSSVGALKTEGFMYRHRKRKWKKYWFELKNGNLLEYYHSKVGKLGGTLKRKSKPIGVIQLLLSKIRKTDQMREGRHYFEIHSTQKVYFLSGMTEEEHQSWLRTLIQGSTSD